MPGPRDRRLGALEAGRDTLVSFAGIADEVDRLMGVIPEPPPDLTDQQQVAWIANWMETNRE